MAKWKSTRVRLGVPAAASIREASFPATQRDTSRSRLHADHYRAAARTVELRQHHALPSPELRLAAFDRDVERRPEHHGKDVGLRVTLAMAVTRLARHELFQMRQQVTADVGVPILGDDYGSGGMGQEDIAQPALNSALVHRVID